MPAATSEPLVFWRETGDRRRGLACHVQFCENPACACEEAFVQAYEVGERFHSIVSRGESLELRHLEGEAAPPSRKASAVIDLGSGRLVRDREQTTGEAELLEWLRDAIDDPALARLRSMWSAFKEELRSEEDAIQKRTWKERDWTSWDGEAPIAWSEIVGAGETDLYERPEGCYEASDSYCIRPGCDCNEVTIQFFEESDDLLGEVFLDEESGEVIGTGSRPGGHRILLDLLDRFESRRDLATFTRRAERMTRIGPELHALRRQQLRPSGGKTGRNAPCPCGSGKKFKNCCGR